MSFATVTKCLVLRRRQVVIRRAAAHQVAARQAKVARRRQVQAAKRFNERNEWVRWDQQHKKGGKENRIMLRTIGSLEWGTWFAVSAAVIVLMLGILAFVLKPHIFGEIETKHEAEQRGSILAFAIVGFLILMGMAVLVNFQ